VIDLVDSSSSSDEDDYGDFATRHGPSTRPSPGKAPLPQPLNSRTSGSSSIAALLRSAPAGPNPSRPASSRKPDTQLWTCKHAPSSEADLVVHKAKVQEVKVWMQGQLARVGPSGAGPRALVATGPCGCGKSATLAVLADELGFEVCEWVTPAPLLDAERKYLVGI
jgi:hypothetical protein